MVFDLDPDEGADILKCAERRQSVYSPCARNAHFGESITAEDIDDYIWIKPKLVAAVAFTEWTDGRVLRHAAFEGLRDDKEPTEVIREYAQDLIEYQLPTTTTLTRLHWTSVMTSFKTASVILAICCVVSVARAAPVKPTVRPALETFDYRGVTLTGGPYKVQLDDVHSYYLKLSDDDLLKPFRIRAKRAAPGNDLGGWYSSDTFHIFGQIISGLSRIYAATGDEKCRAKANRLIDEWALCIAPDGYFYSAPAPNAPHYIYDKMVSGLLDNYLYCDHKPSLEHLSRITDWAQKNLDRNITTIRPNTEWYTLSENLYRAYLATGDPKYRDFAEVWKYNDYWDLYADQIDLFNSTDGRKKDHYHAYSHINTLGGAGLAYAVTGKSFYLDTIVNAFRYIGTNELYATGGFGPDEQLLPKSQLSAALQTTHKSFETQCGAWAVFKLCKQLTAYTGDSSPGDWVEAVAFNGLCATIPMTPDGRVFYYSDYNLHGGEKVNVPFPWACCAGTRPQAAADLDGLIYFKDSENIFVSQFTPSTVHWERSNNVVTITQQTAFPESEIVTFTIGVAEPSTFRVNVRVPQWLASPMHWKINNSNVNYAIDSHGWASIKREWKNGDTLTVRLPMSLRLVPLQTTNLFPAAVAYGPVVLAFEAPAAKLVRQLATKNILDQLQPIAGNPLQFTFINNASIHALPFYAVPARQIYFIYVDSHVGAQISTANMHFTGKWNAHPRFHVANQPGASVTAQFQGSNITWNGFRFPDAGHAEIVIDGNKIAIVDLYGPKKAEPFTWNHDGLSPGKHSITVRILPDKNEKSTGRFINIASFAEGAD